MGGKQGGGSRIHLQFYHSNIRFQLNYLKNQKGQRKVKHKRILVIEDNSLNMKLVRVLLAIGKHKVIEALDAESGIRLAREQKPDLILMDFQLPNMDGLDATRIIKADPILKETTIIALTSRAMDGDEQRAKEAGCDDYISKPIDTKLFLKTVAQYLTV